MIRISGLVTAIAFVLSANATPAVASDPNVEPGPNQYIVEGDKYNQDPGDQDVPAGDSGLAGSWHSRPMCSDGGYCIACPNGETRLYVWYRTPEGEDLPGQAVCPGSDAPARPQLTIEMVASALRRVPLPPSKLIIQPPDGRTLVNFETNFYTPERTLFRSVRLLGQRVELRITASRYTWHFGDGTTTATEEAGAPYPKLTITHNYLRTGRYAPSLDTTYVADFRVGSGPWREVPGSVTIEGEPASIRAIEATPTLVGYSG